MNKSLGAKTLIYPAPVLVVGTYDKAGKPNVMTASWGGICCSQPPCIAVSLRKATYSYNNILERKAFTISIPDLFQSTSRSLFNSRPFIPLSSTLMRRPTLSPYLSVSFS